MNDTCEHLEPILDLLAAGAEEELSEAERKAARDHLAVCADCRERLQASQAMMAGWSGELQSDPGPNHRAMLQAKVMERIEAKPWWRTIWDGLGGARTLLPVASLIMAALIVGLLSLESPVAPIAPPDNVPDQLASLMTLDPTTDTSTLGDLDEEVTQQLDEAILGELEDEIELDDLSSVSVAGGDLFSSLDYLSDEEMRLLIEKLDSQLPAGT